MSVSYVHADYPQRPEEGIRSPRIGVRDGCEPTCRDWELNPGSLEQQPLFLNTEPSFQSLKHVLIETLSIGVRRKRGTQKECKACPKCEPGPERELSLS